MLCPILLKLTRVFLLALMLAGGILSADASTRRALVIGLGRYADPSWAPIHGDSDADIVTAMLRSGGYGSITVLKNHKATKAAIIAAFRRLVSDSRRGDTVYIHFSGHGQQVTDVNGDEDDGFDEAWIPYDAYKTYSASYKGEKHLLDDEVAYWMSRLRDRVGQAGQLLVVVDACHSGDSSRGDECDSMCDGPCYVRGTSSDFIIPLATAPRRTAKVREDWLTLTACRDYQVNYEVKTSDGAYYGMLTYALWRLRADLAGLDNPEVASRLQTFVNRHRCHMPQNPTLSGRVTSTRLSGFFTR